MNDEIDLKKYIRFLLSKWYWLLIPTVVVSVAVVLFLSLSNPTYEASAMVIVTRARNIANFDSRFETVTNIIPAYKAFLDLATGDELWVPLLNEWQASHPEKEWFLQDLQKLGKAAAGSDQSVIMLTIRWKDPEEAARLANEWAAAFVRLANEIYGGQSKDQLLFFQQQLNDSRADLEKKSITLEEFYSKNSPDLLNEEIIALLDEQKEYLARQRSIPARIMDAEAIIQQLEERPVNVTSLADPITFLMLQTKLYTTTGGSTPFLLQVDPSAINSGSRSDQITMLKIWIKAMNDQSMIVANYLEALAPKIMEKQTRLQKMLDEKNRLVREQEVAEETFITMARKVDESRILTMDDTGDIKLASYAVTPERPTPRNTLQYTAAAGAGIFILVGIVLTLLYWWRSIKDGNSDPINQTEKAKKHS